MPPKTERLELRLEPEIITKVDDWRREQADNPSRSEAMRRLIETGLETSTTRQNYLSMKFQIMTAALTKGPGQFISDAYLYAWEADVYPFDSRAKWHAPFETSFLVTKEMIAELSEYLDGRWHRKQKIPTFYELEDRYGVRHGRTAWDRHALIVALRYMWLCNHFDKRFWDALMAPMEHPSEASGVTREFDRTSDIYFQ